MIQSLPKIDLDAIPGLVILTDGNGVIKYVNQQCLETTGFTLEEMLGCSITTLWDSPDGIFSEILTGLEETGAWRSTIRHQKKDGTYFQELCAISKIPSENEEEFFFLKVGNMAGSDSDPQKVTHDIQTKKHSTENNTVETGKGFQTIVDQSPCPAMIIRLSDRQCVLVNEFFCRKMGYTRKEILNKSLSELKLFKTSAEMEEFTKAFLHNNQMENVEFELQTKAGGILEILASSRNILFNDEDCIHWVWTDIGELKEVQRALKESEESYHTIMKSSPIAISITRSSDARYVDVNDAWAQRTGFSRQEVIGRTSPELNVYRDLNVRKKLWEQFEKNGQVDDLELAFRNRRGENLYSLVSARRILFKGEECLLYISTKIDALKATQKALAEREQNYRTIMEMAPFTIAITRRSDATYLQVNKVFSRRIGYTADEAIGKTPSDLNVYANPSDQNRILDRLRKDGRVSSMEIPFRAKDGHVLDTLISMSFIHFQGEDCIISMVVDVSEMKETQKALEESEARFRTIFETAADPIFLNDMDSGRFLDVNSAACRHLGYEKTEFYKMSLAQISPPKTIDPFIHFDQNPPESSGFFFESMNIRKDGSRAIVEVSSQQMVHQDRSVLLSIVRDVTQRKQAENELARYRENLEQMVSERTQELKAAQNELVKQEKLAVLGQLTATVSHELRNPLGVMRSSNFFLQRKVKDKKGKIEKHFQRIDEQISICDAIVGDLLEYTRGRSVATVSDNVEPWVIQVVELIKEQEQVQIFLEMDEELDPVPHDQEKMKRVLINLLNNAVQAVNAKAEIPTPKNVVYSAKISVHVKQKENNVCLMVRDNGIGMDEETRQQAFEPLFTTRARGTGIGLANVKKIVEDHLGSIQFESRQGEGTQITVVLPGTHNGE